MQNLEVKYAKIVIVDDSQLVRLKIKRLLETVQSNYAIFEASDGREGLELIHREMPDLIITDLEMPHKDGLELSRAVREHPDTAWIPIVMLTAASSEENMIAAMRIGVNDFFSKNFTYDVELLLKVESLLKFKFAVDRLENASNVIATLCKAVELKDEYTKGHAQRVSQLSRKIAEYLGLSADRVETVATGGLLHDIGTICLDEKLLNKPGKLTEAEFESLKNHCILGEEICSPIKIFGKVREIVRNHHEKLNGRGYPDGLSGDQIKLETRIVTVADIYDALTSTRSYRKAMNKYEAFKVLMEMVYRNEIDLRVVNALNGVIES